MWYPFRCLTISSLSIFGLTNASSCPLYQVFLGCQKPIGWSFSCQGAKLVQVCETFFRSTEKFLSGQLACLFIITCFSPAATSLSQAWCCLWEDSVSPLSPQYAGWMSGMFPFCPHNKRAVRNPISIVSCVRKMPFSNTTWHHLHTPRSAVP